MLIDTLIPSHLFIRLGMGGLEVLYAPSCCVPKDGGRSRLFATQDHDGTGDGQATAGLGVPMTQK